MEKAVRILKTIKTKLFSLLLLIYLNQNFVQHYGYRFHLQGTELLSHRPGFSIELKIPEEVNNKKLLNRPRHFTHALHYTDSQKCFSSKMLKKNQYLSSFWLLISKHTGLLTKSAMLLLHTFQCPAVTVSREDKHSKASYHHCLCLAYSLGLNSLLPQNCYFFLFPKEKGQKYKCF